jgi:hypothetical protein
MIAKMSTAALPPKIPLDELISLMDTEHKRVAEKICEDYKDIMYAIPGSSSKHQVWEGGYVSHIEEAMNLAIIFYHQLHSRRPLDFSLSSALFCLFLHDFDKVQRYTVICGQLQSKGGYNKNYIDETRRIVSQDYGYELTDEEYNALKYAHGEGEDFQPGGKRVMQPLTTLVHCCDVISARIWHNYGKLHDSWEV